MTENLNGQSAKAESATIKIQKSLNGVVVETIVKGYDSTNEAENDYQEFIGYYMKIAAFKAVAKELCHYQEQPFSRFSNNRQMEYVTQNEDNVFRVVITLRENEKEG